MERCLGELSAANLNSAGTDTFYFCFGLRGQRNGQDNRGNDQRNHQVADFQEHVHDELDG